MVWYVDSFFSLFFFFNATATTEIYTLSLHDALPISDGAEDVDDPHREVAVLALEADALLGVARPQERKRSEEHTSELQSPDHLVCRLLLEKKKKQTKNYTATTPATHRSTPPPLTQHF